MKLRIKGSSLRLRVTPSEVTQLLRDGAIREFVQFTADPGDRLTYALAGSVSAPTVTVAYRQGDIHVSLPNTQLAAWSASEDVGLYADVPLGAGRTLSVAIEKDFACLDRSDAENEDTFPNPNLLAAC